MVRVGIDLGGTNVAFGITKEDGTLICKSSVPTKRDLDADALTVYIAESVFKWLEEQGIKESDIVSIGIGVPGIPDDTNGVIVYTTNLPFYHTKAREIFHRYTKLPLRMSNDANCAALGEVICGAAKGYKTSLTITLGTGVGGGVIIDGKIFEGFNGAGGELGHMKIHTDGALCGCGRKGCLEAHASATALIRETVRAMETHPESIIAKLCEGDPSRINAKTAFDAMREGDAVGTAIVQRYIEDLGEGIINYVNIFQPEIILIGGGVSKEGENLLAPLREYVFKYAYGTDILPRTRIEKTLLGNDAGIIGAAMIE